MIQAESILVQTTNGHALLDPYTTLLGPGIPIPWKIKCSNLPLSIPYDGLLAPNDPDGKSASRSSKRRKIKREISQNEQANIDLHNELRAWLPNAIEGVREAYVGTSAPRWYSRDRLHTNISLLPEETHRQPTDLVAWGKEVSEIRALNLEGDTLKHERLAELKELAGELVSPLKWSLGSH